MRFFITFSSDDHEISEYIARTLNHIFKGHATFFCAAGGIEPGDVWLARIKEEIEQSASVLLLLTQHSFRKPWVNIELGAFWVSDKRIHPLLCCGVKADKLHRPLSDHQWVDLQVSIDVDRLIGALGDQIGMSHPVIYDSKAIVTEITRLCGQAQKSFRTIGELRRAVPFRAPLTYEALGQYEIQCTSPSVQVQKISSNTLNLSGYVKDSATITLEGRHSWMDKKHLILQIRNSEDSTSDNLDKLLKVCVNHHALRPLLKQQRHFDDEEYIYKGDGYIAYKLPPQTPTTSIFIEFVMWKIRFYELRISFALV